MGNFVFLIQSKRPSALFIPNKSSASVSKIPLYSSEYSSAFFMILTALSKDSELVIKNNEEKKEFGNPKPPFTTSTLQQEASRKLNFSASRTMKAAQKLYEGLNVGSETTGLITYMRTDSVQLSKESVNEIRKKIVLD